MHPRTIATLDELHAVEWFRNVGVRDTEVADILSSWSEAIASSSTIEWQNLRLEAVNQYSARLIERSVAEYRKWNDIVISIKPAAQALVREKTEEVIAKHDLPKTFVNTVNWDIIHLCMECEYADIYPPGFFASQAYWYKKGHFPCGWRGTFPKNGRLVIY